MTTAALGAYPVTLAGYGLTVIPDPEKPGDRPVFGVSGVFASQVPANVIAKRDVAIQLRRFSAGFGRVRRRDADDDGGYGWLENGLGWLGNGLRPAGRLLANQTNTIANTGWIIGSVQMGTDTYLLATLRCLLRFANSDPSLTPTVEPTAAAATAGGWGPAAGFRTGYIPLSIAVWQTGTGDVSGPGLPCIVVGCYNTATGESRLYRFIPSTGNWRESNVLGYRCYKMQTVYWTAEDGTGANRLVIAISDNQVRHVIQGQDALDPVQWVTPIQVGTTVYDFKQLVATPQHIWALKQDGIWDVGPIRAANVTPYWEARPAAQNALSTLVFGDYLYTARDFGLDRYPVAQDGLQQRVPGECAPAFGTQDGHPIRGYNTALAVHEGALLSAIYNPNLLTTYVMRGFPKQSWERGRENPLEWHGAEAVIPPSGGAGFQVTHMRVGSPALGTSGTQPALTTYLWLCVLNSASPATIDIWYQPLPSSSGPISLALTQAGTPGGSFVSHPTARYYLTQQDWDDDNATKFVRRSDVRGQMIDGSHYLDLFSRTDAASPITVLDQSTWTSETPTHITTNSAKVLPTPVTSGKTIAYQVVATTPAPYTAPPIFQSLSPRAKVVRETYKVIVLNVLLEKGIELGNGAPEQADPDAVFDAITALQDLGPQSYVDEKGTARTVLVEQGARFDRLHIEGNEFRNVLRLELSLVT